MAAASRHLLAVGLVGSLLALLPLAAGPAAGAQSARPGYHPRADHIGVVVTAGQVLMSWHRLEGADAGTAIVRRGEGACPRTPTEGSTAGPVTRLHIIDGSVQAGTTYCYTLFSRAASGAVRTIGSSGLLTVPDTGVVPPATVPAPAPAPTVTISARPSPARVLALAAAAVLAILLGGLVGLGTRRVAAGRAVVPATARESMSRRAGAALVVPAMIALGWLCLLIGYVVLQ